MRVWKLRLDGHIYPKGHESPPGDKGRLMATDSGEKRKNQEGNITENGLEN